MSYIEAFKPEYHANHLQPTVPVLGLGMVPDLDPEVKRMSFDWHITGCGELTNSSGSATAALYAEDWSHGSTRLAITSPNMSASVWPHYGWCKIQMDESWRFGKFDPMFAPQLWRSRVPHYATVPFPSKKMDRSNGTTLCLWEVWDEAQFAKHAAESELGGLDLYTVDAVPKARLEKELDLVRSRTRKVDEDWSLGLTQLLPNQDATTRALTRSARVAMAGLDAPAELHVAMARVTFLKRTILELHGRLTWLELRPVLYDPPRTPRERRRDLMGAVVGREDVADRFFRVSSRSEDDFNVVY